MVFALFLCEDHFQGNVVITSDNANPLSKIYRIQTSHNQLLRFRGNIFELTIE